MTRRNIFTESSKQVEAYGSKVRNPCAVVDYMQMMNSATIRTGEAVSIKQRIVERTYNW